MPNRSTVRTCIAVGCVGLCSVGHSPVSAQDPRSVELETFIEELARRGQFNGNIVVAAEGEIIYERSIGVRSWMAGDSLDLHSQFRLASAGKPFTALAVIQLEEAGLLDFDDPVDMYVPDWPYRGGTIRHLLNHTSGLPDFTEVTDRHWKPDLRKDDPARVLGGNDHVIELLREYRPDPLFEPGDQYAYSDTGYALLASIIERVSGLAYHEYMRTKVFLPAGMVDTYAVSPLRPDSLEARVYGWRLSLDGPERESVDFRYIDAVEGSSGIYSTVRDLYRWDRALHTGLLVSPASLSGAYSPAVLNDGATTRYGFGWSLGAGTVSHDGYAAGFGVWIYRELEQQNTIIILTTGGLYLWAGVNQGVRQILRGKDYDLPRLNGARLVGLSLLNEGEDAARTLYADLRENRASEYEFGDVGVLQGIGRQLMDAERLTEALAAFRFDTEVEPKEPFPWTLLGDAYLALGDTISAVESYRRVLALDPQSRRAQEMLRVLGRR